MRNGGQGNCAHVMVLNALIVNHCVGSIPSRTMTGALVIYCEVLFHIFGLDLALVGSTHQFHICLLDFLSGDLF